MKALLLLLALFAPAAFAEEDSHLHIVGATLLTLCGDPVAIEYLVSEDGGHGILTVSRFDSRPQEFKAQADKVREVAKRHGPGDVIELDDHCQKT